MKRMLIETSEIRGMIRQLVIDEGHADELLHGDKPDIRVVIDEEGAHVMMPNVKGDLD